MNAMVPGLGGGKMSSSDPNSKIDFLDPPEVVRRKIKGAFCEEGNVAENGVLSFVEAVLIPISQLRVERLQGKTGSDAGEGAGATGDQTSFVLESAPEGTVFSIFRKEEHGGALHYSTIDQLKEDFKEKRVHPKDLKTAVADAIVRLLDPVRKAFEQDEEWQKAEKLAYPDPNAKPEKKKKVCHFHFGVVGTTGGCVEHICRSKYTTRHPPARARTRSLPMRLWPHRQRPLQPRRQKTMAHTRPRRERSSKRARHNPIEWLVYTTIYERL